MLNIFNRKIRQGGSNITISITCYQRYLHLLQGYVKPQGHVLVYETYLLACTFCRNYDENNLI
jgi:hypothetical protein